MSAKSRLYTMLVVVALVAMVALAIAAFYSGGFAFLNDVNEIAGGCAGGGCTLRGALPFGV